MIQDILIIFRWAVILIGSFYGFLKLTKTNIKIINLIDFIFAIILAIALYYMTKQLKILRPIGFLLLSNLYLLIRYRGPISNTIIIGTISCGFSIITITFALVISIPFDFLVFICKLNDVVSEILVMSLNCIFQIIFTFLIYRIKRLKSGISIQNNDGNLELLLLISILSIFLMSLFYTDDIDNSPFTIILICFIFCGLGFIVWWKKHITGNYQKQLYKRNETQYEARIKEYEKERAELLANNDELAKIIHRDNKLIPAMVIAVNDLIKSGNSSEDAVKILSQLEELSSERKEVIERYQAKSDTLPKTNNAAFDGVLRYIESRATQSGVEFSVNINQECISLLLTKITDSTDLSTILCDLGENAIIAAKNNTNGKVFISFELSDSGQPRFCFYDNGALFDEKVIANMGRKKITTHSSEGGSGIGLMVLFEILNKYNASFCLNESTDNKDFTKCIEITFDDLHNISILTTRDSVKKLCLSRADLVIL